MMFQVIGVGFLLLTVSLLTGVVFSEEVLGHAAALTHKTVLPSCPGCCSAAC